MHKRCGTNKNGPGDAAKRETARILNRTTDGSDFYRLGLDPSCLCRDEQPDRSLGITAKHPRLAELPFQQKSANWQLNKTMDTPLVHTKCIQWNPFRSPHNDQAALLF